MDVLRRLDEFGEAYQLIARLGVARTGHFYQDRVIALDDQGVVIYQNRGKCLMSVTSTTLFGDHRSIVICDLIPIYCGS